MADFPITHSWFQLKTFFESYGFKQVPSGTNFLYFKNDKTRHTITFEKSNKITIHAVRRILDRTGFTYEFFVLTVYGDQNKPAS